MKNALIGITIHPTSAPDRDDLDRLLQGIVRGVERAGGLPVLIPAGLEPNTAVGLLDRLDGLLLSGGGDIDPALYGADWHETITGVDPQRDRLELALTRYALQQRVPLFGICRGAQMINIAVGGSLYRDISEHPGAQIHTFYPGYAFDYLAHRVEIAVNSRLAGILGTQPLEVNSLHHQALRKLAPGLLPAAIAPDGIIEAFEVPTHVFTLAVQWHPEALPEDAAERRLFSAFVDACVRAT